MHTSYMPRHQSDIFERMHAMVSPEPMSGCWLWTGAIDKDGYGRAYISNKPGGKGLNGRSRTGTTLAAHRIMFQVYRGEIPNGLGIDHLCRNRLCVNPAHLEAVTCRENLMRGNTHAKINSDKTVCLRGHEYKLRSDGGRFCPACRNIQQRLRRNTLSN